MEIPTDLHVLAAIGLVVAIGSCLLFVLNQWNQFQDRKEPVPPLHRQYVSQDQCHERHKLVFAMQDLEDQFFTRREWEAAEKDLREIKRDVKVLLGRTGGMATTDEVVQ